ncbi:MAG: hypothetical protein ACKVW3_12145 [Phycisphaerales bacterium]
MKTILNLGTGITAMCVLAGMSAAPVHAAPGFRVAAISTSPRPSAPEAKPRTAGPDTPNCPANCDESTIVPYITVNDFICFQNLYVTALTETQAQQLGSPANCDASTIPPVLNVGDFMCFMSICAAGCSAP